MLSLERYAPYALSILRIVAAIIFFEHGTGKMFGFPAGNPVAMMSLPWFAATIEIIGGTLLFFGLFSRAAAFIMSGEMAFAYFMSHAPRGLYPLTNGGDAAILYCFVFLFIVFAGGGAWSLDALLRKKD